MTKPSFVSIVKTVTPTGTVHYGDLLTYTLVISATPSQQIALYDRLDGTTFVRFAEQPTGVAHADGVITGTLTMTPAQYVTVAFVAQVGIPGTAGFTVDVTNRACVYLLPGTLGLCQWSNTVTNPAFRPYSVYLPVVLRRSP